MSPSSAQVEVAPRRRRTHPVLAAAPVVLAIAVTVAALWAIVSWQQESHRAGLRQVALGELDASANHLRSLEWQAIAGGGANGEVLAAMRRTRAAIDSGLLALLRLNPPDAVIRIRLPLAIVDYERAVSQELGLLGSGQMVAGRKLDQALVDPRFATLSGILTSAATAEEHLGDAALRRATAGSALAGGFAVLIAGVLMGLFLRSRRRLLVRGGEEAGIRRSEREFRALAQNASDLVTVVDRDLTIDYQSDSIERILGYPLATISGRPLAELIHPDDLSRVAALVTGDGAVARDVQTRFECRLRHREGHWIDMETVVAPLVSDEDDGGRFVLTSREIGERKALEEQLRHQAFHDALTGLPNRALFEDRVSHALVAARRKGRPVAVMFADLDDFKLVNDSLGHAAGDDLLRIVAQRLRSAIREGDTAARLSGDEFAVLLEDDVDVETTTEMADRILRVVGEPVVIVDREVLPRVSVGVAVSDADAQQVDVLMRNADIAMYAAKGRTKNGLAVFDPGMHATAMRRLALIEDLEHALARDEFEIHYQPIVALDTEVVAGVEALLRWNHPTQGLLAPLEFIPLAEQSGAIVPIGRWVLHEACRQVGVWDRDRSLADSLHVCVNLSTLQLDDPELVSDVRSALAGGDLRPDQLVLEITESLLIEDVERTRTRLEQLKTVGVLLAVDDFGTGYSSLSYLRDFPLDILKIDKSFIDGLARGTDQSNIVRALIELGSSLNLNIVAEGIEQPDQLAELRTMRSPFGQGFLFGRPLPADQLTMLLESPPDPALVHAAALT